MSKSLDYFAQRVYNNYVKKIKNEKEKMKIMKTQNEKTMKTREWKANEKQEQFLQVLKNYENGATLKDIELDTGVAFATGCINTLVSRGLVRVEDSVRVSDKVYRGVVIAQVKDPVKKYFLA